MPFYHVQHSVSLDASQRQSLPTKITHLHSTTFNAPSLFVNIKFSPSPSGQDSNEEHYFIGGKLKASGQTNVIFAYVRGGGSRSQSAFDKLAEEVEKIWDEVTGLKGSLQAVFIVSGIVARERGLRIPPVGEEGKWMDDNWSEFERRVAGGDEDFRGLVEEVDEAALVYMAWSYVKDISSGYQVAIRMPPSNRPVTDVTSDDITCNVNGNNVPSGVSTAIATEGDAIKVQIRAKDFLKGAQSTTIETIEV
ncbi:hypothetical protein G7Y89_g9048 [Cudoniella acicularis]|uniref:Tautomerase cis-CaaD-like domain-containing protein n=1 Tax=Cudoniella acicularis TaxID=354080 RepID=A0A8H4RGZ2_9HELO|nr:hypothetical protein G7Y89_g9048 [Cudoniella acicularis]